MTKLETLINEFESVISNAKLKQSDELHALLIEALEAAVVSIKIVGGMDVSAQMELIRSRLSGR